MNSRVRPLLLAVFAALPVAAFAAPIALVNPSFESPAAGRLATGFDSATDVPGWVDTGATYTNSGVEPGLAAGATGGYVNIDGYVAFLRGTDGGAAQTTGHTIAAGEVFRLVWRAGSIDGALAGTTSQQVTLYRTTDGGATRTPLAVSTATLDSTNQVFETYVLEYTATATDAGAALGIEFDNTSASSNRVGFDDFQLEVDPSGPAPATGLPALAWDDGTVDDGTATVTRSTTIDRDFYFTLPTAASLNGGWRTVVRVASGDADVYLARTFWPTASSYNYRSSHPTGDEGFVLRPDQYTPGDEWRVMVRAKAGTTFTVFSGEIFVQDLGSLGYTDSNSNSQYDIGEPILAGGSGAVTVKGEGMRFFKATVPAGTPAWSLWLHGDTRPIAIRKTTVPFHASSSFYGRRQTGGQMLVVPPFLGTGTDTYFLSVEGSPGDALELDSRIQSVEDISFNTTLANVAVSGPPYHVYRTQVPVNQIAWDVSTTAVAGDPNIAVRQGNVPAEFDNDAFSEATGSAADAITLVPDFLTNGTWFVTVYGTGNYTFSLKSGDPVVTPMAFTDTKLNDQTTRAGWRFYSVTDIPSQLGNLGWELLLSNQVAGSQISIRRNKVPGRWQYRINGGTYISDTNSQYADFSSTTGFLQRPGHQADVWYVGVFTPQQPLGAFTLQVHPITPTTITFDSGSSTVTSQEPGRWNFFRVDVPAGIPGWDVRAASVSGGTPQLVVRRDQLPSATNTTPWSYPWTYDTWPSGYSWSAMVDWTGRYYDSGSNIYLANRRLVMGAGSPLEPGTYYVGVYNSDSSSATSYTFQSFGIGTGQTYPVTDLAFSGGTAPITDLAPHEAAFFKVTIPADTPSWEFTLSPSSGELMMAARFGTIPDFAARYSTTSNLQSTSYDDETYIQKTGPERYAIFPANGTDSLQPGDYYIAVVGEGQSPADASHAGTGLSSGTLTSTGPLPVTDLGTASAAGTTTPVSLLGGQVKAYTFTVPAGTASLEVRLDNRVNNPAMSLTTGTRLPYSTYYTSYGVGGGSYDNLVNDDNILTLANPAAGTYTLTVHAGSASNGYPDASADLVVTATAPADLTFDGGAIAISGQSPNSWRYFAVTVPAGVLGWDIRAADVSGGAVQLVVRRDSIPSSVSTTPWSYPWTYSAWTTAYAWSALLDWTGRYYDDSSNAYVGPRRLVMGTGAPLEPGTYFVGVYNNDADQPTSYTIRSFGVGTDQTYPVTDLAFSGGTTSITNLAPREAAYFKVTIPADTPSWEFTLSPSAGELMLAARAGAIPDFAARYSASDNLQNTSGHEEIYIQKTGPERYVALPANNTDSLQAGDYYLAVVSEGQSPADANHTGTGTCSATLTSTGALPVTDLGTASGTGTTTPVSLLGGQVKAYTFTVPAGTASLEVRLDNRVGNPALAVVPGTRLPYSTYYTSYGVGGGTSTNLVNDDHIVTIANPTPGTYTLTVHAGYVSNTYPDASADLVVIANGPADLAFDGGAIAVSGQSPNSWRYFAVTVPAGVSGWDVRVADVSGGAPQLIVRRDSIPSSVYTTPWSYPWNYFAWTTNYAWSAALDWTGRYYDAGTTTNLTSHRLVMGTGAPLEPGTYFVGVYNNDSTNATSYTIRSFGIGAAQTYPVTDLAFAGGTASVTDLAPREATYFKVTVPANSRSWEFTLSPTSGELMMAARFGAIPDFGSRGSYQANLQSTSYHEEVYIQKAGPEHYVILPSNGVDYLQPGDYFIAAVSEGQTPADAYHTGTGTASATLTSTGTLPVTDLGTVSDTASSTPVTLAGGQLKAFTFTVPANAASLEVRLDDRVGNPVLSLVPGARLPYSLYYTSYGSGGGQSSGFTYDDNIVTVLNPVAGTYTLNVYAGYVSNTYPDASATLVVRTKPLQSLNFSATEDGNGLSHTDTRQLLDGQKFFYAVDVPTTLGADPVVGWIIRSNILQGSASIRIYKHFGDTSSSSSITVNSRTAVIVPPYLVPGDTWYVEITATGLTNYTLTSEPVTLNQPAWSMPTAYNQQFGDTGSALGGDKGIDLGQDDWHFYAIDVPEGNGGLLRTELQAINGNPNLYIREDGVPTTDHYSAGGSGSSLVHRTLGYTGTEYGNWVPLSGRTDTRLRPGRWYLGVKATGNTNARYRLLVSTGQVTDLDLSSGSVSSQNLIGRDWRYYRFTVPMDAPKDWTLTFSQQLGDVVMWLRDTVPPGDNDNTFGNSTAYSDVASWYSDSKNQGPYDSAGEDSPGAYTFHTPPLRPGHTYFVGFAAKNDSTFSFSSATAGGTIGTLPTLDFYSGTLDLTLPAGTDAIYRIPVPPEATRLKFNGTYDATVKLRLEQGTLPALTGNQHWISSYASQSLNQSLTVNYWPWYPDHDYYLRLVNTSSSDQHLTLSLAGVNAATEDEDNDGLPDAWETLYFGSPYYYNDASDPDHDGVTNAVEFADGTDPADPNSALYFLTVTTTGGSVTRSPDQAKYAKGTVVTLTATPDSGYAFLGWGGALAGTTTPATVTLTANTTVTALFGLPFAQTLDTPDTWTWTTGGSAPWFGQSAITHDGVDAAQSGAIGDSQETWLQTTVAGPGTIGFWWKVSSETNYDYLEFYVDGALQIGRVSGEVDWTEKTYTVTGTGAHTLRWRYVKDSSQLHGSDTAWVDQVTWTPDSSFSTWLSAHFDASELADDSVSGPSADPDGDGIPNLLEYAFDLDPKSPNASAPVSDTTDDTGHLVFTYIRRTDAPELTYTVEVSTDLANWNSGPAYTEEISATAIDATHELVQVRALANPAGLFARLRVTLATP